MPNRISMDLPQFGELKRCNRDTGGVDDRISNLPDEILSHIQSLLTLKEAVATTLLSRRWNKLGLCILDFEGLKNLGTKVFLQRVNHVLENFKGSKLHKFRVVRPFPSSSASHIHDWISFAFRNYVSELELDFSCLNCPGIPDIYYPLLVFGKEEIINPQCVKKRFECLKDLRLNSISLSNDVFEVILYRCSSLERFLLMYSRGLKTAKNSTPHLKLKSMELYHCKDLEKLELLAPNLVSFHYQGREQSLCIKHAQHLASLSLTVSDYWNSLYYSSKNTLFFPSGSKFLLNQFSSYLPMLESLVVAVHIFEDIKNFAELCVFCNLKHLVLDVTPASFIRLGYQVAASIIRAAPYLELLEIIHPTVRRWYEEIEALELAPMSAHENLKEVKLYGCSGDEYTVEFLTYLLQYAVSLEKIGVTARGALWTGEDRKIISFLNWEADVAEHCKNRMLQFRKTMHGNAQLLFHDK